MMRLAGVVVLAVLGAACAAVDQPKVGKVPDEFRLADGTQVVCRMEAETGSNIRERVCRKVAGNNAAQQNAVNQSISSQQVNKLTGN